MDTMDEKYMMSVSPYDQSFPAKMLEEAFELRMVEAKAKEDEVYERSFKDKMQDISVPDKGEEKMRLVVDESEEFLKEYQEGNVHLAEEKGRKVAQLKENGRYGSKLGIKEEIYSDGPSQLEIDTALKLQQIQKALESLSKQIQTIDSNVKDVIQGQQNDRMGLYYSGVALFMESANIEDEVMRKQMLAQSLKTLTDATFQLTLSLQSDIQYLKDKRYKEDKKKQYDLLLERINNVNKGFSVIHMSYVLKAGIYCQQGELKAMANVLQEYSRLIEGTIVENADMLAQCDPRDDGTAEKGIWNRHSQLKLDVSDVVEALTSDNSAKYIKSGEVD